MDKKFIFILLGLVILFAVVLFFIFNNTNTNTGNYIANRTSGKIDIDNNNAINDNKLENNINTNTDTNKEQNDAVFEENIEPKKEPVETEISSFTTKIYTKDSNRQNNLSIACSTLNDTTVNNGDTFSFTSTVGKATTGKGYKKADVFKNGDVIKALGGGLCQVSTTLYNAVDKIDGIKVTERHGHSNSVPYIKSGRDAAVSYGTYDFKFINNTGNTLKIKASNTKNDMTITIFKIE